MAALWLIHPRTRSQGYLYKRSGTLISFAPGYAYDLASCIFDHGRAAQKGIMAIDRIHPLIQQAQLEAMQSQLSDLQEQLAEYDARLKNAFDFARNRCRF